MVPSAAALGHEDRRAKAKSGILEEEAIVSAANMFRELLANLPFISSAVQDFLYVNWQECRWEEPDEDGEKIERAGLPHKKKKKKSGDTRIVELFWGPRARQDEGIRSGEVRTAGFPAFFTTCSSRRSLPQAARRRWSGQVIRPPRPGNTRHHPAVESKLAS